MEEKSTLTYCVECCAIVQVVHRVVQTLSMGLSVQCRNIELGRSDHFEVVAYNVKGTLGPRLPCEEPLPSILGHPLKGLGIHILAYAWVAPLGLIEDGQSPQGRTTF